MLVVVGINMRGDVCGVVVAVSAGGDSYSGGCVLQQG